MFQVDARPFISFYPVGPIIIQIPCASESDSDTKSEIHTSMTTCKPDIAEEAEPKRSYGPLIPRSLSIVAAVAWEASLGKCCPGFAPTSQQTNKRGRLLVDIHDKRLIQDCCRGIGIADVCGSASPFEVEVSDDHLPWNPAQSTANKRQPQQCRPAEHLSRLRPCGKYWTRLPSRCKGPTRRL